MLIASLFTLRYMIRTPLPKVNQDHELGSLEPGLNNREHTRVPIVKKASDAEVRKELRAIQLADQKRLADKKDRIAKAKDRKSVV